MAKIHGVDSFLNHQDFKRSSAFAEGWKGADAQGQDGVCRTVVWLHRQMWAAECYNHPIPGVIEYTDKTTKDKVLAVRTSRFNCHETDAVYAARYFRTKTGDREVPPVVCPSCILPEVLMDLVAQNKLDWLEPLFRWEGDEEDDSHVVHVAGAYDLFGSKDLNREQRMAMRKKGIKGGDAWKESLLVRMQWAFLVAQAEHIGNGIGITFESKTIGTKMKEAIRKEMRKYKAEANANPGNPVVNPYPFEWSFDDSKEFSDKYDVVALTEDKPTAEVLALIDGPVPKEFEEQLAPGNCWQLRANLEAHVLPGIDLPWDRIFGPAEKAGLMVPPEDSKPDADDDGDDGGSVPEVGRKLETYDVGPEHDVWFDDAKPDPKVKGKRVELEAPEGEDEPTPEVIAQVVQMLTDWGASEVALVMLCDHCDGRMTSLDLECPKCGAEVDDEGHLISRPCLACKSPVEMKGDGPNYICGKCAAIHTLAPEGTGNGVARWTKQAKKEEPKASVAVATGRRRRLGDDDEKKKPEPEPEPTTRKRRGVPFDVGGGK